MLKLTKYVMTILSYKQYNLKKEFVQYLNKNINI